MCSHFHRKHQRKRVNDCLSCCYHMLSRNPPLPVEVSDPDRLLAFKEPIVAADSESAVYPPSIPVPVFGNRCRFLQEAGHFPDGFSFSLQEFPVRISRFCRQLQCKRWDYVSALSLELDQSSGTETRWFLGKWKPRGPFPRNIESLFSSRENK